MILTIALGIVAAVFILALLPDLIKLLGWLLLCFAFTIPAILIFSFPEEASKTAVTLFALGALAAATYWLGDFAEWLGRKSRQRAEAKQEAAK